MKQRKTNPLYLIIAGTLWTIGAVSYVPLRVYLKLKGI